MSTVWVLLCSPFSFKTSESFFQLKVMIFLSLSVLWVVIFQTYQLGPWITSTLLADFFWRLLFASLIVFRLNYLRLSLYLSRLILFFTMLSLLRSSIFFIFYDLKEQQIWKVNSVFLLSERSRINKQHFLLASYILKEKQIFLLFQG